MVLSDSYFKLHFLSLGSTNKKFFEIGFIINRAEYACTVRNLYCEDGSLLEKTTGPGFLGTCPQVLAELT